MLIFLWLIYSGILYVFIEGCSKKIITKEIQISVFFRLGLVYLILTIVSILMPVVDEVNIIRAFIVCLGIINVCWYVIPRIKSEKEGL